MSNDTISYQYLRDSHQHMKFEPESQGKIIFLFFSQEKDSYLRWLESHNRRDETVKNYKVQLDLIAPIVMNNLGSLRFDEIGEDEVYLLMESLSHVSGRTKKTYLETFGRLVYFVTGRNPVTNSRILWDDIEPTHRIFIDNGEWPRIKASAKSSTDRLILYLGAYMGLRRAEMIRLSLQDIDGDYLVIHGKGHGTEGKLDRKEMPEPVRAVLRIYLKERAAYHPDHDQLLIRIDGRQKGKRMNDRAIRYAVDRMVERSGVKFTPHSLRRLYATTMWEATGKDLALTKQATRHASADVLMNCYIKANPQNERAAVERMLNMI